MSDVSVTPVLQAKGLVKEFTQGPAVLRILSGVDFSVMRGERVAARAPYSVRCGR